MADNVAVTAGTGTSIATDQCGSDHYQKIKLADGTADSTAMVAVDVGAKANALRVAPANDITDATYIGDIKFGESLPAGTAAIGKLAANSGVDIGDVDVTSLPAITLAAAQTLATVTSITNAVTVADGGGTLTVDGTVAVTNDDLETLAGTVDTGAVKVAIVSGAGSGGTASDDDADFTAGTTAGTPAMGVYESSPTSVTDGDLGTVGITAGRRLKTSATIDAALPAGTNAIGKLAANSGVDIGDVDVTSLPAVTIAAAQTVAAVTTVGTVTNVVHVDDNSGALTVDGAVTATLAAETTKVIGTVNLAAGQTLGTVSTITNVVHVDDNSGSLTVDGTVTAADCTGSIAHDAEDSGNPVKVGGKAYATDGTAPGTAVTEGDRTNAITDLYGRLLVDTAHPCMWSVSPAAYSSAQTDTEVVAAPGAGTSLYITDIVVSNGATAGTVTFEEDTASAKTKKLATLYLAVNGGAVMNFKTPIRCTAAKNFGVTSTSCTSHSITVNGYTAP